MSDYGSSEATRGDTASVIRAERPAGNPAFLGTPPEVVIYDTSPGHAD